MPNNATNKVVLSNGTTLIDLSQDTVTDASHIMSGRVGHLASGLQVTGTGQSGVNAFIITLSYNSNTSMWEPDCTWVELTVARTAGKDIILTGVSAVGGFSPTDTVYGYTVMEYGDDGDSEYWISEQTYSFSSSGLTKTQTYLYYDSSDADAVANDVTNGKIFYTSSGREVGSYSGGGGSPAQIATGTVTGDGTTTLAISCNFEPDLIYVYGDMSDSASNRGVVSITILKDTFAYMSSDSSTSNTNEGFAFGYHNISGYGDPTILSVTYSNGTLTFNTLSNTSSRRFRSGQTYTYKLVKWTSG